jgi:predicted acyl esterase
MVAALIVAPAAHAADPYTVKAIKVTAKVGPAGDQSCVVDANLYTPAGVDAAHPAAAILTTNGFGGNKDGQATLAKSYATRGYVVLSYSGLGFGNSGCLIELDHPDWDGKAASAMIDFLGGGRAADDATKVDYVIQDAKDHSGTARAHDPRVGMIGGSYGGQVQFAAAKVDSRLDTIIPQITWNDLAYSLAPNNTGATTGVAYADTAPGVEKYQWVSAFFALGVAGTGPSTAGSQDPSHLGPCPNFNAMACTIKAKMDATGYADKDGITFARGASVTSYMSAIQIPTFLAQGETDTLFNLNEVVATYEALRGQGTPVKLLWKSNGHSGGLGDTENNEANPEAAYASRAYLEWMDFYLRGIGDAPKLDFSYYRDWVKPADGAKDAAPAVASAPAYPVAGTETYFLSGTGDLVGAASAVKAGTPAFSFAAGAATSYSETSVAPQDSQPAPTDTPQTAVTFTSAALTKDTDVVGIPQVTVSLDAPVQAGAQGQDPGGRLVLFAKLYEVLPDGTNVLSHRLVAPVRVPDVTKPIAISLPGIAHRFAKGSKFALVIAASDGAYRNNNLPGNVTVKVTPGSPTQLRRPVLGAGSPAAPVGSALAPGAGQLPQVAKEGSDNQAASLPKPRACKRNRRVVRVHFTGVKKPDRIISRRVTVNGKRIKAGHAKVLKIDLRKVRAGTYRIFVLVKSRKHKVRRTARTYKVC